MSKQTVGFVLLLSGLVLLVHGFAIKFFINNPLARLGAPTAGFADYATVALGAVLLLLGLLMRLEDGALSTRSAPKRRGKIKRAKARGDLATDPSIPDSEQHKKRPIDGKWFVLRDKQTLLVTIEQLQLLVRTGKLRNSDQVKQEGMDHWVEAADVPRMLRTILPASGDRNLAPDDMPSSKAVFGLATPAPYPLPNQPTAGRRENQRSNRDDEGENLETVAE